MKRPVVAVLIAVFLSIAIGALGYFLLVGPKKADVDKKQKEIEKIEGEITTAKNNYKQLLDVKNRSAEYEARLASLQAKIPETPELPSLIREILAAADPGTGAGLPWLSFSPAEMQPEATAQPQAGAQQEKTVSSYSFQMTAAGLYDEVVDLIYRMERFERAVIIQSIGLTPTSVILEVEYSPNFGLVQAEIGAKTFTFAQPVTAGAEAQPAQPTPKTTEEGQEESEQGVPE